MPENLGPNPARNRALRESSTDYVMIIDDDALVAYPTDSCYALGCRLGSPSGPERIRRIRGLDDRHHFTLVCSSFAQLGQFVRLDNHAFRAIKAATPGPYTFILPATKEVPRRLAHPKKRTVGVRIVDHPFDPLTDGWQIKDELDRVIDAVVDSGETGVEPTTVVDWSEGFPEVVRVGAGDPSVFE